MKDKNATVIVDLVPEKKLIMKKLHKDARWGIKRSQKDGLRVQQTVEDKDWQDFYEIYSQTMIEGGSNPESLEKLKENTRAFFVCKKDETIIAGAGIWFTDLYNSEIPRLYINASLKEYQKSQPNNLLYWACILWCKKKGYQKFDLGGWQINARDHLIGINKFKEKWGEIVFYNKDYSASQAIGRKLIRNSDFFWNLNKKLKHRT